MFESLQTIHWLKKGPLAVVWTAAYLAESDIKIKLNRRMCVKVNVSKVCETLLTTEVPISLRLSAWLMYGIIRIHQKQANLALIDTEYLKQRFDSLNAISLDSQARPDKITFPEPDFNASFSSISDLEAFNLLFSSPMAGYFNMEIEVDRRLITDGPPTSPPPRTGSIRGTPPNEQSFTADPKDISIEDGEPEKNLLETSLMESMYFGDEDPMLVMPNRNVDSPTNMKLEDKPHPPQDLVLLFDDSTNSFSYSDGVGADISSSLIVSPMDTLPHAAQEKTHMPLAFESPFLGKKNSHSNSSNSHLGAAGSHKLTHSVENYKQSGNQPVKRRKRRKEKFCALDEVIGLSRHKMKEEASNITAYTRTVNLQAVEKQKALKPKDLLFQLYTEPENNLKLSKSLLQPSLVIERDTIAEFTLDNLQTAPPMTHAQTPITTPIWSHLSMSDNSVNHSTHSDLEVVRGGSYRDDLSYDNPLTNASTVSGDTTIRSSGGNSFQFSTALRLNAENEDKRTQNPPPLVTGSLSPIMDMDEDSRNASGASVGAMPSLDDSDCQTMKQGVSRQPTSPFIEHNPEMFADHLMSLLEHKKEIRFKELLPGGSTRKTAGVVFHHILGILSSSKQVQVEQTAPYGPIVLKSSTKHQPVSLS